MWIVVGMDFFKVTIGEVGMRYSVCFLFWMVLVIQHVICGNTSLVTPKAKVSHNLIAFVEPSSQG